MNWGEEIIHYNIKQAGPIMLKAETEICRIECGFLQLINGQYRRSSVFLA